MVSRESGVPVGLFGAQRITMSGSSRSISDTAVAADSSKSASRAPLSHSVPVPDASNGYIE